MPRVAFIPMIGFPELILLGLVVVIIVLSLLAMFAIEKTTRNWQKRNQKTVIRRKRPPEDNQG